MLYIHIQLWQCLSAAPDLIMHYEYITNASCIYSVLAQFYNLIVYSAQVYDVDRVLFTLHFGADISFKASFAPKLRCAP